MVKIKIKRNRSKMNEKFWLNLSSEFKAKKNYSLKSIYIKLPVKNNQVFIQGKDAFFLNRQECAQANKNLQQEPTSK